MREAENGGDSSESEVEGGEEVGASNPTSLNRHKKKQKNTQKTQKNTHKKTQETQT